MNKKKIAVVGAGASGMTAAIVAAKAGAEVTLFEGGERVGKKILSTGNGKCNLSNLDLDASDYHGGASDWIAQCLSQFQPKDCIEYFDWLGLLIKNKNGYLYPLSEQASSVLDVLRTMVSMENVRVYTSSRVKEIRKNKAGGFTVDTDGRSTSYDRVILACGGQAAPKTGSDGSGYQIAAKLGHKIVPVVPALVQLRCSDPFFKEIAGVRVDALLQIEQGSDCSEQYLEERGELQLTDYGISGIPVFQLSRTVNYLLAGPQKEVVVSIDFLPDYTEKMLDSLLEKRWNCYTIPMRDEITIEEFFTGILNKKIMLLFIKMSGLKRDQKLAGAKLHKLQKVFYFCKHLQVHVTGSNSFDNAQVCAGGVDTAEVKTSMESKLVKGLYFAGELLDVDGRCGGYNLHWAWCSGYLAGKNAAVDGD